jgi:hypothetical protein
VLSVTKFLKLTKKQVVHGVNNSVADQIKVLQPSKLCPPYSVHRKKISFICFGFQISVLEAQLSVLFTISGSKSCIFAITYYKILNILLAPFVRDVLVKKSSCETQHFVHGALLWL